MTEFIYAYRSGLKVWVPLVQDTFRLPPVISVVVSIYLIISTTVPQIPVLMLHPEFCMRSIHHDHCPKNWFFSFPISADGRRGLFPLWDSSQSFDFYLLPSPVRRFVRATICPCTPFFTHPVTCTNICWFPFWPGFVTWGIDLNSYFNGQSLAC